jgi:hypothetical protein
MPNCCASPNSTNASLIDIGVTAANCAAKPGTARRADDPDPHRGRPFGSLRCHTRRNAGRHRAVREVEVMRDGAVPADPTSPGSGRRARAHRHQARGPPPVVLDLGRYVPDNSCATPCGAVWRSGQCLDHPRQLPPCRSVPACTKKKARDDRGPLLPPRRTARQCLISGGSLPPLAASFDITCLCSQTFMLAESLVSPV